MKNEEPWVQDAYYSIRLWQWNQRSIVFLEARFWSCLTLSISLPCQSMGSFLLVGSIASGVDTVFSFVPPRSKPTGMRVLCSQAAGGFSGMDSFLWSIREI